LAGGGVLELGENGTVAVALSLETFDFLKGGNAAPCAECFAVQSRRGAGKVQNALQFPALQKAERETGVKQIAGSSGVHDANFVGRRIPEAATVPSKSAVDAERGANRVIAEFAFEQRQSFQEIRFARGGGREVARDDGVVDEFEYRSKLGRPAVEVGDDGNSRRASPDRGATGSGGVMTVNVEKPSRGDPVFCNKGRRDAEARVAVPGDGAFAGLRVDKNEGQMTRGAAAEGQMKGNAFATEGAAVEFGSRIVSDAADIMRAKSPTAASDHGGGDLAAEKDLRAENFCFMTGTRETGELVDGVGGVFADAEDVEFFRGAHGARAE